MDWQPLLDAATAVRDRAHAPYSRYRVGSAILFGDGSIVVGANVENRSYGLCVCAERVAMTSAVVQGLTEPLAVAVITESSPPAAPCGLCLETLAEFADDLPILLANVEGQTEEVTLRELFPRHFVLPER